VALKRDIRRHLRNHLKKNSSAKNEVR
jgi:hypothetical protein